MSHFKLLLTLSIFVHFISSGTSFACTLFAIPQSLEKVVGASMDWTFENGVLVVNKRNVFKRAFVQEANVKPAEWTSQFGSITFSQIGREFPWGGMNEKGLSVHVLWLEITHYPEASGRPVLNDTQWIQYQLDNFASTEEVVSNLNKVAIYNAVYPSHYFICDSSLDCAVIEFIDQEVVVHRQDRLPVKTLSNSPYEKALQYYQRISEGKLPPPGPCLIPGHGGPGQIGNFCSLKRFARAAYWAINKYDINVDYVAQAFDILDKARMDLLGGLGNISFSQWHIVYNSKNKLIHFRTWKTRESVKYFHLSDFDFSCSLPVQILDVSLEEKGNVSARFHDYDRELTKYIATKNLKPQEIDKYLDEKLDYPDKHTKCLD